MANYFVDFSAANNGDGSDGAQAGAPAGVGAFNQLTVTENATIVATDSVYIRRTGSGSVKTITFKDGVYYYGWPKSTDENYAGRPSNTVDGTWNSDGDNWAFFTAPTVQPTLVDIEFWRLRAHISSGGTVQFFGQTSTHGNLFWNHCVSDNIGGGNVAIAGSISGTGRFKMRDCKCIVATGTFSIGPNMGGTGYVDVETTLEHTTGYNSNESITVNPNSTGANVWRFIVLGYVNSGTGRLTWTDSGGSRGMVTMGFADGAAGNAKNTQVEVTTVNSQGSRVKLVNIDQTGNSGTNGLLVSGGRDSKFIELINCVFVGATADIAFPSNARVRITGRNVTFEKTKVTFGSTATTVDPDHQAIFVEDFSEIKGNYLRMNSRGFHQQSAAARTGGAAESILMETRSQGDPVGNPEPFMVTDAIGLEPLRAYLSSTSAKTVTVYIYTKDWSGNEDKSNIWLEVDYYDEVGTGHVKTASSRDDNVTPAALTADGSTWTGVTGGTEQKLAVTFTPGRIGRCAIRVCIADSYAPGGNRSKVYVDPIAVVT